MKNNGKVILIFPPNNMNAIFGRGKHFIQATEPLGILSIAAVLEENGIDVEILDAFALGFGIKEIIEFLRIKRPNIVGISCLTSDAPITKVLAQQIKAQFPEITLVLGNLHASVYSDYFLKEAGADIVTHGEAEYTMLDIVNAINEKKGLNEIMGISWKNKNTIVNNTVRPLIMDLDRLPMPARHLAPMDKYKWPFYFHPSRIRGIVTSRGCPIGCTFCAVHTGRTPRYRSALKVMEEFDVLVRKYDAEFVFFLDPLFIANRQRIDEVCDALVAKNNKIKWACEGHVNYIKPDILKKMKKAGCYHIAFGIESGVQQLLENVGKKSTIERIKEAVCQTKEAGINAVGLFMLGLPGETKELSLQTIKFAKELPLDFAQFSITTPYPGTQLYNSLVKEGKIDPYAWERYSAYATFTDNLPIYTPEGMTGEELKSLQRKAIKEFFLRPKIILKELRKVRFNNLVQVYYACSSVLIK